jgi:hypothetical protein
MPSGDRNKQDFNSSPEDKELNQFYSQLEIPNHNICQLPPTSLFTSTLKETTFASTEEVNQENSTQEQQQKTLLTMETLVRKRKTIELIDIDSNMHQNDNLDTKMPALNVGAQINNNASVLNEITKKNSTARLPTGAIHIFPEQIHYGPNSFGIVISTCGTVITTKVAQSDEGTNFTVDVLYQFNGMPSHSFKFSHCPEKNIDGVVSDNIETIYSFS